MKQFEKKLTTSDESKLYSFIYQQYDNKKLTSNTHKNNSIFKFLVTNSKFNFTKKSVKSGEPSTSTAVPGTSKTDSDFEFSSESKFEKNFEEFEIKENSNEKRKFSSMSIVCSTKQSENACENEPKGPSALDSLDSYYDSFLSVTRKTNEKEESVTEERNPAKKHCASFNRLMESEPVKSEEFKQKCSTSNDSSDEIQPPSQPVAEEIPCTPEQTSLSSYLARRLQMRKSTDTPPNLNSTKNDDLDSSCQIVEATSSENNVVPSSQPPEENNRRYQKLKITNFFKKLDK